MGEKANENFYTTEDWSGPTCNLMPLVLVLARDLVVLETESLVLPKKDGTLFETYKFQFHPKRYFFLVF